MASPDPSSASIAAPSSAALNLLDNPIWNALGTSHSGLALTNGLARRYPLEIGPLSGLPDQSPLSYDALRALAGPGGVIVLFLDHAASPPPGWTQLRDGFVDQMICLAPRSEQPGANLAPPSELRQLSSADVPSMIALAKLTEPGPFHQRTIELGVFFGIFEAGRLMAMSGQRLQFPQFIEVSAVCTHPDGRGRGYARILMAKVMEDIHRRGKTPMLHVLSTNSSAISVYHSLGFTLRRSFHLAVLRNDA